MRMICDERLHGVNEHAHTLRFTATDGNVSRDGPILRAPGFFRPCARFFTISSKYDRTGSGRQMKNKSARRIWQRAAFILCVCLFPVFNGHARLFEDLLIVGVGGKVARSRIFSAQRLDSVFELTELEVIDIVPFNI